MWAEIYTPGDRFSTTIHNYIVTERVDVVLVTTITLYTQQYVKKDRIFICFSSISWN